VQRRKLGRILQHRQNAVADEFYRGLVAGQDESAAVRLPASVSRTASVTAAPVEASALAVSIPIPEEPPVTIARLPDISMRSTTSAAVESNPKGTTPAGSEALGVIPRGCGIQPRATMDLLGLVVTGPWSARATTATKPQTTSRRWDVAAGD
jgi:hypothetical protein